MGVQEYQEEVIVSTSTWSEATRSTFYPTFKAHERSRLTLFVVHFSHEFYLFFIYYIYIQKYVYRRDTVAFVDSV